MSGHVWCMMCMMCVSTIIYKIYKNIYKNNNKRQAKRLLVKTFANFAALPPSTKNFLHAKVEYTILT